MIHKIRTLQKGLLRCFLVGVAAILIFGAAGWSDAIAASEYTMKIGHATAKDAQDAMANHFAKKVEEFSDGRIKAPVYNASQLGNNPKMNKDVRSGAQEALIQPAGFAVPYIRTLAVLDLPFLFSGHEVFAKVMLMNNKATEPLRKAARKAGLEIVSFLGCGFKYFCTTFPLKTFEDLKGRKIRVIQSPVLISQIKAFSAIGIPMPLGELYTALQQGVVEGFTNPVSIIERMKYYEVSKYTTNTIHGGNASMVFVNKRWFDSLPAVLQEAVRKAGMATEGRVGAEYMSKFDQRSLEIIKKKAVYAEFPETERAKMKTAVKGIWDKMRENPATAEALETLLKGIDAATK